MTAMPHQAHVCSTSIKTQRPIQQVLSASPNQGPMLFLLGGTALACLLTTWARGSSLRITNPYFFSVTFSQGTDMVMDNLIMYHYSHSLTFFSPTLLLLHRSLEKL
jgi:hypothetical protein